MTQIIRLDLKTRWDDPVGVRRVDGGIDNIVGPGDALAFLVTRWSRHKGPSYKLARRYCQDALRGKIATSMSRAQFIKACIDANILE